jgi:hypothetical protein
MAWLDPQVQFKLAINPVNSFMVHLKPFTLRGYKKHSPKPQLRWLFVSHINQSAMKSFSASSLALYLWYA